MAVVGTSTYVRVLRHGPLVALLVSHGIATVAQQMVVLAAGAFVLSRTDSPVRTSITVALGCAPYLLLSTTRAGSPIGTRAPQSCAGPSARGPC